MILVVDSVVASVLAGLVGNRSGRPRLKEALGGYLYEATTSMRRSSLRRRSRLHAWADRWEGAPTQGANDLEDAFRDERRRVLATLIGFLGDFDLAEEAAEIAVGGCENRTTMSQRTVPTIRFDAMLYTIDKWTIVRLPERASRKLPSRGQVAIQGTINGHGLETVLEPDGYLGHWMRIDGKLQRAAGLSAGDTATVEIELLEDWPEPSVPKDLEAALAAAPQKIRAIWKDITPMARWEWVRWVNATNNPDTRKRRVEVSISKIKSGKRRPCCFNLAACTDSNLSKSGRLIEPA